MAHKKGVGSSKNGRESESKRLGVKLFGGESAKAGNIILRQRGTTHHPGENAGMGRDHTIYALIDGTVVFRKGKNDRSYISVQHIEDEPVTVQVEDAVEAV
jgi:large subunit ribosomal protein L27